MGSFTPDPPVTNIGYTKSEGSNRVSASNDLTAALLRFLRSLAKLSGIAHVHSSCSPSK